MVGNDSGGFSLIETMIAMGIGLLSLLAVASTIDLSSKIDSGAKFRAEVDDYSKMITSALGDNAFCTKNLAGVVVDVTAAKNTPSDFPFEIKNINPDDSLGAVIFKNGQSLSDYTKIDNIKYYFEVSPGGGKYFGKISTGYSTTKSVVGSASIMRLINFYVEVDADFKLVECGSALSSQGTGQKIYDGDGTILGEFLGYNSVGAFYMGVNSAGVVFSAPSSSPIAEYYTSTDCTGTPHYNPWSGSLNYSHTLKSCIKTGVLSANTRADFFSKMIYSPATNSGNCISLPGGANDLAAPPTTFPTAVTGPCPDPCGSLPCYVK